MTSDEAFDIAYLRGWIGREDVASAVVSDDLIPKFYATFDIPSDPPGHGEAAPGLIHFCLAPSLAATSALGPDGHPARGGFLPPVPLPRRMWAGSRLIFHRSIAVGETVRRMSRIADVAVKQGRSGVLVYVSVDHVLDVGGALAVTETQDIVYRGPDGGESASTTPAPESTAHRRRIEPSAPFLFRYSALTFNGHRIHYDRAYATGVEGYPGLVVHGPLQATLLVLHATAIGRAPPASFSFRSLSPLFDNELFFIDAIEHENTLTLWTSRESGSIAMRAKAIWA